MLSVFLSYALLVAITIVKESVDTISIIIDTSVLYVIALFDSCNCRILSHITIHTF